MRSMCSKKPFAAMALRKSWTRIQGSQFTAIRVCNGRQGQGLQARASAWNFILFAKSACCNFESLLLALVTSYICRDEYFHAIALAASWVWMVEEPDVTTFSLNAFCEVGEVRTGVSACLRHGERCSKVDHGIMAWHTKAAAFSVRKTPD